MLNLYHARGTCVEFKRSTIGWFLGQMLGEVISWSLMYNNFSMRVGKPTFPYLFSICARPFGYNKEVP